MGGLPQNADAFLIDAVNGSGGNQQESLYIELRQGGTPVDPDEWFDLNRE
jgi:septal ring factor EnvC (AmiA/AmiB activator)